MAWTIEPTRRFERELAKLDKPVQRKILSYLENRVAPAVDPRTLGKALGYDLTGFWRYRVGDYRILCKIEDDQLVIVAVSVAIAASSIVASISHYADPSEEAESRSEASFCNYSLSETST